MEVAITSLGSTTFRYDLRAHHLNAVPLSAKHESCSRFSIRSYSVGFSGDLFVLRGEIAWNCSAKIINNREFEKQPFNIIIQVHSTTVRTIRIMFVFSQIDEWNKLRRCCGELPP